MIVNEDTTVIEAPTTTGGEGERNSEGDTVSESKPVIVAVIEGVGVPEKAGDKVRYC